MNKDDDLRIAIAACKTKQEILDVTGWVRPWSSRLYWDNDMSGTIGAAVYDKDKAQQRPANDRHTPGE